MRISCVVKVNLSIFQKSVTLSVMFAAKWNRDPCQMVTPSNVMIFDAVDVSADHASRDSGCLSRSHDFTPKKE